MPSFRLVLYAGTPYRMRYLDLSLSQRGKAPYDLVISLEALRLAFRSACQTCLLTQAASVQWTTDPWLDVVAEP